MARNRTPPTKESIAVGKRIAQARTKAEHTQETLAKMMGVSGALVAQYETGVTGLTTKRVDQLVGLLGITMSWLLTGDEPDQMIKAHTEAEKKALATIREVPAEKQAAYLEATEAIARAMAK